MRKIDFPLLAMSDGFVERGNLVDIKYFYLRKALGKVLNGRLMAKIKNEALGDKFAYEQETETNSRKKYFLDWKGCDLQHKLGISFGTYGFFTLFLLDFVIKIQIFKQSKTG